MAKINDNIAKKSTGGGALIGKKQGQTILHKSGSLGGYATGRYHHNGGIKATIRNSNRMVEFQGGEAILTAPAMADQTLHDFNGRKLNNRQIASEINVSGGGVSFADGGEIPHIITTTGKEYTYNGANVSDTDILTHHCGCHHHMAAGGIVDKDKFKAAKALIKKMKPVKGKIQQHEISIANQKPELFLQTLADQALGYSRLPNGERDHLQSKYGEKKKDVINKYGSAIVNAAIELYPATTIVIEKKITGIIAYHGSEYDFNVFKPKNYGTYGLHEYYYFAKSKSWIEKFAQEEQVGDKDNFKIKKYVLNVSNPLDLRVGAKTIEDWIIFFENNGVVIPDDIKKDWAKRTSDKNENYLVPVWLLIRFDNGPLRQSLINAGFDYLIINDKVRGNTDNTSYVVFDNKNILDSSGNLLKEELIPRYKEGGRIKIDLSPFAEKILFRLHLNPDSFVLVHKNESSQLKNVQDAGLIYETIATEKYPHSEVRLTDTGKIFVSTYKFSKQSKSPGLVTQETQTEFKYFKGITYKYENAFILNKAIEEFLDQLGKDEVLTPAQKVFLSYYSGYGGLEKFGATGKGLLYEYFTPDDIVKRMWGLAYFHGYKGGKIGEFACGTGAFIKYAPDESLVTGYEINPYSHRICTLLYPGAKINLDSFETLFIKNNSSVKDRIAGLAKFELIIGNPPYGEFGGRYAGMGEKAYTKADNYVDYFIFRGLDLLQKDGLLIQIIGTEVANGGTPWLQKPINKTKAEIIAKANIIDAYRLPNGVFDRTDVLSDIIVLQKK